MVELVLEGLELLVGQRLEGLGRTPPGLLKVQQAFEGREELGCQRQPGS